MRPTALNDGFALRLALFYATLGIATGIGMPYFPLWLENKGLNASQIGIVLATPMLVRIVCVPLVTRIADRFNVLRAGILVTSIGAAIGNAAIGFADSFIAIIALMIFAAVFFTPTFPLTDAYALRGLAERQRAYGPVRLWSSAAFIGANIGGGLLLGVLARDNIIWLIVTAFIIGVICATRLVPLTVHHGPEPTTQPSAKALWRLPVFVTVIVACSLVQASHAVYYGFSTLAWTAKGLSDTTIGLLWAIGVVAEIGFFMMAGFLGQIMGPIAMVVLGACGGVVRWTVMAFDPPFILLPFLQCLHALTFCATHVGAMQVLSRVAPPGLGATAQGDFAAVQAVIFGTAMLLSGTLFRAYGDLAYLAMTLLSVIGAAVSLVAYLRWRAAAR